MLHSVALRIGRQFSVLSDDALIAGTAGRIA
jgi:hypothetical protein